MDRSQDEKEKEEVKMGARVNLWVLVFALVLISSTWYISELPDKVYISMSEPQPYPVDTVTVGSGTEETGDEHVFYSSNGTLEFYDVIATADDIHPDGRIFMQTSGGGVFFRGRWPMDSLHPNNLGGHILLTDGKDIEPNYDTDTAKTVIVVTNHTWGEIYSDEYTGVRIYFQLLSSVMEGYESSSVTYGLTAVPANDPRNMYLWNHTILQQTGVCTASELMSGVWLNVTFTSAQRSAMLTYSSELIRVHFNAEDGIMHHTVAIKVACWFERPAEGGVYETENGETVVVHDNTIWNHLNILKVSAGLVGAMCILAAVASTPLWNPTRAWGRRRGRR